MNFLLIIDKIHILWKEKFKKKRTQTKLKNTSKLCYLSSLILVYKKHYIYPEAMIEDSNNTKWIIEQC